MSDATDKEVVPPSMDSSEKPAGLPKPKDVQISQVNKRSGAFSWPSRFFLRENISVSWENSPFIAEDLKSTTAELEGDDVGFMLSTEENWAPDRYRIDCILDIVREANLKKLREGDEGAQRDKIALLIDGNNSGARPSFRKFLGGLNAQELYEELRKQCQGPLIHTDGIYATTMRCMVTGYDQWRWTGLVLVKTWFDEILDDPSPDMKTGYENDFQDGMISDPLWRRKDDATRTEWSPRPYFIRVLEIRITRRHEDFMTHARVPAKEPQEFHKRQGQFLREFDEFERGFGELKGILEELAQDLKETVRSGEFFMNTDVRYFINYDESEDESLCVLHLTQIRNTFNILEQLGMRLRDMQQKCRDLMDEAVSARKIPSEPL
ncbi:uncharacterized protein BDZ83DRAFT_731188 [Colletotrichum acutatum]|uniref:Uncharacterized protein n=1 Tax=Glomerella acutata TaxID=27357 RepID=A0AAD8XEM7_GLOAC|nr:uncharacterized protein BDZ83DRAFT_731188 [Colletotrichum acutatum]KAK1724437.1 hypothetical protein BDZ83DRAFT_731188 [Colletotrichum acutatum]